MTAYYPGPRQGAAPDRDAFAVNPIGTTSSTIRYSTRRNFYSTKFAPLSNFFSTSNHYKEGVFVETAEGYPADIQNVTLQNSIQADGTTGLNNSYYLDF